MRTEVKSKVWLNRIHESVEEDLAKALEWLHWSEIIPSNARVAIKPNFTYPFYKPGVTTNPAVLEAVVSLIRTRTDKITIVESDGGSYAWPAQEAFAGHHVCLLYTSPSPRDLSTSRMPSSA